MSGLPFSFITLPLIGGGDFPALHVGQSTIGSQIIIKTMMVVNSRSGFMFSSMFCVNYMVKHTICNKRICSFKNVPLGQYYPFFHMLFEPNYRGNSAKTWCILLF